MVTTNKLTKPAPLENIAHSKRLLAKERAERLAAFTEDAQAIVDGFHASMMSTADLVKRIVALQVNVDTAAERRAYQRGYHARKRKEIIMRRRQADELRRFRKHLAAGAAAPTTRRASP